MHVFSVVVLVLTHSIWAQTTAQSGSTTGPPKPTQSHPQPEVGVGPAWRYARNARGIAYKPIPKDITPTSSSIIPDSDMYNSDFTAIWGIDHTHGVKSRNDLVTLVSQGFNQLHVYDWNPAADQRSHRVFLDRCAALGVGIWIPLSNYVFLEGWDTREQFALGIIRSVTDDNGNVHSAVYGWMIANEYDLQDFIEVGQVAEMIMIMAQLDPGNTRPFCIPTSTTEGYNDIPDAGMGSLVELHDNLPEDIFFNRLMHGTNPFMSFDAVVEHIFEPYLRQFEAWGQPPIPLLLTEMGRSSGDINSDAQVLELSGLASGFIEMMNGDRPNPYNFAGYFLFEYTQESWRVDSEALYGMNALGDNMSPVKPKTNYMYGGGSPYDVEELLPVEAFLHFVDGVCVGLKKLDKTVSWDNLNVACLKPNDIVLPGDEDVPGGEGGSGGSGLSGAAVAGLVFAIVLGVLVLVGVFWFCNRRGALRKNQERLINSSDNSLTTINDHNRHSRISV